MGRRRKNQNSWDYISLPDFDLDDRAKRSIIIVLLFVLGLISLLGLFDLSGNFGEFMSKWLALIFGNGKWLVPAIFIYWASLLIRRERRPLRLNDYFGLGMLFVSYQTLFHFFIDPLKWQEAARLGEGGGYVGYYFSRAFFYVFGFWGGVIILLAALLIALILVFNTSLARIVGRESFFAKIFKPFAVFFHTLFSRSEEDEKEGEDEERASLIESAREEVLSAWQKRDVEIASEEISDPEESPVPAAKNKNQKLIQEKIAWPKRAIKIDLPIELLNNKFSKAIGGDIELNGQKIQTTLEKFGIDVEMGETKVGPTVTQYTFRPAEGVKLSRITTLKKQH